MRTTLAMLILSMLLPLTARPQGFYPDVERYIDFELADSHLIESSYEIGYLRELTARHLKLIRNSIYARKGLIFNSYWLNAYFQQKSWYKPTVSRLEDIHLDRNEALNVNLIAKMEAGALPEWVEYRLFQLFPDLDHIRAAMRLNAGNNYYWLVSLFPTEMKERLSDAYYRTMSTLTQQTVDSVRSTLEPRSTYRSDDLQMIRGTLLSNEISTYRGSRWIEALNVEGGEVSVLPNVNLDRMDYFLPKGIAGAFQTFRSNGKNIIDCEIANYSLDLRTFWQSAENGQTFTFAQGLCCCACDCHIQLWKCSITEGKLELIEVIDIGE